jgi:glyoxylase-like metal-dependent hydrolase (beta-lactamase superfamily II)
MEVAPGIYSMMQRQGVLVHAYLIDLGDGLLLVDTLYGTDARLILDELQRIGKPVSAIKHILLTHAHRAHLGGLAALKASSGAEVLCHEWEQDIVEGDRRIQFTTFRPLPPLRVYPFQVASYFGSPPPCKVDGHLREGDKVGPLHVIYTPGHTPGHLAFYWPERRVLFAGDTLVTWPSFAPGWPGFMLNHKQNNASMHHMAELDVQILCCGHGDPLPTDGGPRLRELLARVDKGDAQQSLI